ncbi:MAG: triose-phosphate isomerase, partial [Nitrospirae bacterium]
IAANWKMHKTIGETEEYIKSFLPMVKDVEDVEILLAPTYTSLMAASALLKDSNVKLGAQNMHWEDKGAYTGEISPIMLLDVGCSHVIIGHSERRQYFGETDETVNKRIAAAKKHGLGVIFCIGETIEEREAGKTYDVLKRQLSGGLKDLDIKDITIAYEPVWAIGTGKTATPEMANEAHTFIRNWLKENYGKEGEEVRIQYGGSVKPGNVKELMEQPEIDGALVGGASLEPDSFAQIVKYK